ncbi:PAS domain S-box protein [Limnobacter sp.]|uniref:PAS domain S-box protein n=1 Tax=Limnobacter sp. TaxID=2003368 RepID=UPI0035137FEA
MHLNRPGPAELTKKKSRYQWILTGATLFALGLGLLGERLSTLKELENIAEQSARTQLRLTNDILSSEFEGVVSAFDAAAEQLAHLAESGDLLALEDKLTLLDQALPAIDVVIARDIGGQMLGQTKLDRALIGTQAIFNPDPRFSFNQRLISISKGADAQGRLLLSLNYQLKTAQGDVSGLLQGRLNIKHFESLLTSLSLGENFINGIAFEDGTALVSVPKRAGLLGTTLPKVGESPSDFLNKHFADHYFAQGQLKLGLQNGVYIPLKLFSLSDAAPARSEWRETSARLFLAYFALCGAVIVLVRIARRFRARHLADKAAAIEQQQFHDERFQLATEAAGIGVWEYNIQDRLIRWDKAMRRIYGTHEDQEMIGYKEWLGFVLPEDVNKLGTVLLEAGKNRDRFEFQFKIRRISDGRIRHIQARATTHYDTHGTPIRMIGVNVDITVQKQYEDALREAEDRFRSSFEWAAIGMAMFDLQGKFIQVNKALQTILGYNEPELLAMTFESVTHPQDMQQHIHLVQELLKRKRHHYQLEKRYIHKDGHVVWVHLSVSAVRNEKARVMYFIAQIQDISERKRNEATLIEREHFLRTLSECLPGLVSYWSTDLRCHFANRNHEKWTALPAEKMRGIHMRKVLGETLFVSEHKHVIGVLKGEKQRFERRKALPSGGYADMLVHLIPDVLYGKVEGFFSISTNITDFKAQQRELERMNLELTERTAQAEAANKAKGAFLANMSHEIRTPMNAIMGMLQLMEDTAMQPEQRDYLSKIGSAAEVLLNVLNDILDISRVEANKLELSIGRFLLDQVLNKATDLFAYRAEEKGVNLYCTKDPDCPVSLEGDRLRLAQVLNNLLSNALKFTEKGHIHLQVKPAQNGQLLQFSVKDTGIGMTTEQCERLFKPFSQVDDSSSRRFGGAGLGLSICKSLVELMGGNIWVESGLGQGSIFHFTVRCVSPEYTIRQEDEQPLKLSAPIEDTQTVEQTPSTQTVLQGQRVLVVDDHKLNRTVASEMLKRWGAQVELAENGRQAVQACTTKTFDLVLMDLQMPEMDGFEATAAILEELGEHAPPIVAVTASATEQDRLQILEAGMCEHLVKPFKKESLLRIVLDLKGLPSGQH